MAYGIIYRAHNLVNNKNYIGQTIKSLDTRKNAHYSKYSNCVYFHKALEKYAKTDWEWLIIDEAENQQELDNKEKYWIAFYKSNNSEYGYNLTEGGQGSPGVVVTNEHKQKVRETMCALKQNNYSKPNSPVKPVRCVETQECFLSYSDASRKTGANANSIRRVIKGELKTAGGYHWELLAGEERLKYCPNAIYCVELNKIYDTVRQARIEDQFHHSNLCKAMKAGEPDAPKSYAGYTFYWVNPEYHKKSGTT